jgi:superfamily II DNA or RNA helicase
MVDPPRLRPGDVVRIRAERWVVQQRAVLGDVSTLDVRGADGTNAGQRARFLLPFESIEPTAMPRQPKVVRPAEWRLIARNTLAAGTPSFDSLRVAANARFDVMPYQLEPALAVTGGHGCRLLIADDVGLGKTVQAGLIVAELLHRDPNAHALVICPASLRSQWQQELHDRFNLSALVLDSTGIARLAATHDESANPWSAAPLVIASIDFIKRPEVMRAVEGLVWDVLVFDEAHNLATRSDRAAAAAAIAWRARTVVMLTGTPHSGDEAAFARLCSIGDVRGRFPLLLFRRTRRDAGIPVERSGRWLHVRPTTAEARLHGALIEYARRVWQEPDPGQGGRLAMTVLLRRASSSAASLARSLDRRLIALGNRSTDTAPQLALPFANDDTDEEPADLLLTPGLSDVSEERVLVEGLLGLARVAAIDESKMATLLRWLSRVREPVLVFTEYRDTLVHLKDAILHAGIAADRIAELHGALTRTEREQAERRFATGDADILLATDAASEGLNLHHRCRCVVNLEIPWSPVRLEQRVGRVDRIGQRKRVHALHLVAAGTYETDTVRRLIDRARTAASALNDTAPRYEATTHAILTGAALPDSGDRELPASIRRPDLARRAAVEAHWIASARRLGHSSSRTRHRPVATAACSRSQRLVCGFEVTVVDEDGLPLWLTTIGVEIGTLVRPSNPDKVRQGVEGVLNHLLEAARAAAEDLAKVAGDTMTATARIARDREEAIASAVRLRHARIASDLLQPGLFDRRAERRAAAQSAVLEEALGRCQDRLESLARLSNPHIDAPALRFAVFLR